MMFFLIDELETLISAKKNSRGWDSEHGISYWTIRGLKNALGIGKGKMKRPTLPSSS